MKFRYFLLLTAVLTTMVFCGSIAQAQVQETAEAYALPYKDAHRSIVGPTAFGLKKGQGTYQMGEFIFHGAEYAVLDQLTVGVITDVNSFFSERYSPTFMLKAKTQMAISEKWHAAAGVYGGHLYGNTQLAALGYTMITYGRPEANASIGLGYFGSQDNQNGQGIMVLLGGSKRLANRWALTGEGWILLEPTRSGYVMYATRYIAGAVQLLNRWGTVDLGLMSYTEDFEFAFYPLIYVGASVPFGKW